ncbi:MAG: OmpA family protein [Pseudomonadota bacterium]
MTRARHPILILSTASLLVLTACSSPDRLGDTDPNQNTRQGALLGGILGAGVGAIFSDNKAKGAVIGGALGAGAGAVTGSILDRQEAELRQELQNDDIRITNTGDRLILSMPNAILFDVDSAVVNSGLRSDLFTVASSLQKYPESDVQIVGHTDNSGGAAYNQGLSERRANSVADVLQEGGVAFRRLETIGRGEDQPVASNLTAEGKAQNRRVEIVILPTA